jgi:asparagine N-glycosylation enzyme membrane subunit Stt3
MNLNLRTIVCYGAIAFFIGFCFVAGSYVAHDMFRTVDDENIVWLINRAGAAVVITLFIALGFITARAVEYMVIRWWKRRKEETNSHDD